MARLSVSRLAATLGLALWLGFPAGASAQQHIGDTSTVRNDVSRTIGANSAALAVGEAVYRDEGVRTGVDSTTRLVFLDSTNLAVGPTSRVVLDRFVYDSTPTNQAMAVNLAKGVFRFTTGVLDKDAYSLTTPTASIGVRGTVLDIAVDGTRTRVTLVEGSALVCPRRKGTAFEQEARDCSHDKPPSDAGAARHCDCVRLTQPGQTAAATLKSSTGAVQASLVSAAVQFSAFCSSDPSLCATSQSASLSAPAALGGSGSLCGR